jgi:histidinol-phosphate aminotransferase
MSRVTPENLIRPELRALTAYQVPESQGFIKLDAMENPYGWPPEMTAAWLETLRQAPLNRYPDPNAANLKERLRAFMGIPLEVDLLLGNGSDELIQLLILAVNGPGRVVLSPEPSFVMYRLIAQYVGIDYVGVPLREDFSLDCQGMLDAIAHYRPALTFLAYPNNPTGNRFDRDSVAKIIAASPGLVVVDEAYFPFANHSFLASLSAFDNLLVMRTVSKMGLAGLRLGLLMGAPSWLAEFEKLRLPYNINILTQLSAEFALANREILDAQALQIRTDRDLLFEALNALPGVTPYPSEANFILFRLPKAAQQAFEYLKKAGILVKNLSANRGSLQNCLRVTVGTPEENQAFLVALVDALG